MRHAQETLVVSLFVSLVMLAFAMMAAIRLRAHRHRPKNKTSPPGNSPNTTTPPLICWSIQESAIAIRP
ncbi:hypothetical protein CO683_38365 [Bradyrhizobium ottawaense]|uniref:hypothetical protein n=1 Tax=unclassified Bradyrhizobium TaxID=2631580 RepID=UPI000BE8BC7E|nr:MULTISPECIES: hypothetical protein [unclassified Bradyrhizobium]MDA9391363.1 hypothetical protein [Bradyrhizobium sp. CCBAU 45394]MDA9535809.1 hypothetical protein [Bradyrhizobium sp. CCBAU 21362]PDT64423.1 hypothetical protein CO683_38365 [Bradyrhizobium ottawaense]MDA9490073.1 hypothetical protein [Bradyrhizobium sp. CCBAU 11361]QHP67869.1 hypothetical protein EI171_11065 [Bradyrhizobium sp. LCT2]